ncbi:hypothetical protein [Mesorhizobium xinjiangense]|uniref:hypothetical protein n=1 Tax=Mesorhizobium xinjiangense TaxID=2678685 RepID=UPI0012EDD861|nr:hypothetical protein [Mesorhizobium xinjiangense]
MNIGSTYIGSIDLVAGLCNFAESRAHNDLPYQNRLKRIVTHSAWRALHIVTD